MFNIFINDLLFVFMDILNFADNNTVSDFKPTIDEVIESLTRNLDLILTWFKFNSMVANTSKFQLIFPRTPNANVSIKVSNNSRPRINGLASKAKCMMEFVIPSTTKPDVDLMASIVLCRNHAIAKVYKTMFVIQTSTSRNVHGI